MPTLAAALWLEELIIVLLPAGVDQMERACQLILALDCLLDHGLKVHDHDFPSDESLQNLIWVFHSEVSPIKPPIELLLILILEEFVLRGLFWFDCAPVS